MNWMTSGKKRVQKRLSKRQQEQKLRLSARSKLLAEPHHVYTAAVTKPLPQPYAEIQTGGVGQRSTAAMPSPDVRDTVISYDILQISGNLQGMKLARSSMRNSSDGVYPYQSTSSYQESIQPSKKPKVVKSKSERTQELIDQLDLSPSDEEQPLSPSSPPAQDPPLKHKQPRKAKVSSNVDDLYGFKLGNTNPTEPPTKVTQHPIVPPLQSQHVFIEKKPTITMKEIGTQTCTSDIIKKEGEGEEVDDNEGILFFNDGKRCTDVSSQVSATTTTTIRERGGPFATTSKFSHSNFNVPYAREDSKQSKSQNDYSYLTEKWDMFEGSYDDERDNRNKRAYRSQGYSNRNHRSSAGSFGDRYPEANEIVDIDDEELYAEDFISSSYY